jgi:short-subunit dehydrogenase
MIYKKALITGATSGIGEALSYLLASKGISLLLTGRNREKLEELRKALSQVPVEIRAADLANPAEREKLIAWMREEKPDLVINNAGYGLYGEAIDLDTDEQLRLVEVDVNAVVHLTVEAGKEMVASVEKGVIMNVSSAACYQIFPHFAAYAASKAFVTTFSRSLDFELRSRGVRVLVCCPGQIATGFYRRAHGTGKRSASMVMNVNDAAQEIWWQIQRKKQIHIFDWRYRFATYLSYFLPASWIAPLLQREIKSRRA